MKLSALIPVAGLLVLPVVAFGSEEATRQDPDLVWKNLMAGNARFVSGKPLRPNQTLARRTELAKGQKPPVVVLSCADSRIPPEMVFDQGLGDVFTVRVAGNIVDEDVLGSIEYAIEHLGSSLIVVMGHQSCGAVKAVVDKAEADGHILPLVKHIMPVVEADRKKPGADPKNLLDDSINDNVRQSVKQLNADETLSKFVASKKIKVVGARYQLDSGKVQVIQ